MTILHFKKLWIIFKASSSFMNRGRNALSEMQQMQCGISKVEFSFNALGNFLWESEAVRTMKSHFLLTFD